MIQQDTTKLINESINAISTTLPEKHHLLLKGDTTTVVDSLKSIVHAPTLNFDIPYLFHQKAESVMDSTMMFKIIKPIFHLQSGIEGKSFPSLPQTENWVFVTLILLFFLFVVSISQSPGLIMETAKSFFQIKERSSIFSKATISDFRFRFFLIVFSVGTLSLYVYLQIHGNSTEFSIKEYTYFLLFTGVFFWIKSLLIDLLGYVFFDTKSLKIAKTSYFNVIYFLGVLLFPLLIIHIYVPVFLLVATEIISLIVCLIGCILVTIKLFQIFSHKIVASFYIMLYLCTLEILPLIALFRVYYLIV